MPCSCRYLCGLSVNEEISLQTGIELRPFERELAYDEIKTMCIEKGPCSDLAYALAMASFGRVGAELHLEAKTEHELAGLRTRAGWWISFLSVVTESYVVSFFESSESLSRVESVLLSPATNNLIPCPLCMASLSSDDEIRRIIDGANCLLDDKRFALASNIYWSYRFQPQLAAQLALLWTGIDILIPSSGHSTKNRINALCDYAGVESGFVKGLYRERNRAVHEGRVQDASSIFVIARILNRLILRCCDNGALLVIPD